MKKVKILDVGITSAKESEILEYITKGLEKPAEKYFIVTPNPEILMYAVKHPSFKKILNEAKIALPDGVGVILASKIMGEPIEHRVTGVDLMENVCKAMSKRIGTVGFLGGQGGVAERTAECLKKKYPGLKVNFAADEWNQSKIEAKKIDFLFVAFGFPKQEEWIYNNLPQIPVTAAMGVGGAFDYFSGKIPRAPKLIRIIGLEWLFRLIVQPWRIKRQLALPKFTLHIIKRKFTKSN